MANKLQIRVDGEQALLCGKALALPDRLGGGKQLPVAVGAVDAVVIYQNHPSHTHAADRFGGHAAQSKDGDGGVLQLFHRRVAQQGAGPHQPLIVHRFPPSSLFV